MVAVAYSYLHCRYNHLLQLSLAKRVFELPEVLSFLTNNCGPIALLLHDNMVAGIPEKKYNSSASWKYP